MIEILTGETPKLHEYCFVRKGKGVIVNRRKHYQCQSNEGDALFIDSSYDHGMHSLNCKAAEILEIII